MGAAARAMANFGLNDLRLVAPYMPACEDAAENICPSWLKEASKAAVGAGDIIRKARIYKTLIEASSDCGLLLGSSSLHKLKPERDVVLLEDAGKYISKRSGKKKVGLVFGSEKTGLTKEDLSYCHAIVNIPTRENQPSMNLGQSVAVVCYEIACRAKGSSPRFKRPVFEPSAREIDRVTRQICERLKESAILNIGNVHHAREIRRGLLDARLTKGAMNALKILLRGKK